jgi:uncharacterized damage-inducible protein DinB
VPTRTGIDDLEVEMNTADLLTDGFGRVRETTLDAIEGLTIDQLAHRVDGRSNSIGWLVWHLIRVQDDHVSEVAGVEQVWTSQGWVDRFALPFSREATGYGHRSDEVAAVRVEAELLQGYLEAVHAASLAFVATLADSDLDRIVDERWDPPVSLGARLVSVISDDLQHAGQAAFIRGLIDDGAK